jgi:hypothetical protein
MSFVRKSFAPRAGAGTEITPDKVLDNYYGFNRLLELKQGAMGDSLWDAGDSDVRSGKKYGKTGGVTGTGTGAITVQIAAYGDNVSIPAGPPYVYATICSYTVEADYNYVACDGMVIWDSAGSGQTIRVTKNGVQQSISGGTLSGTCSHLGSGSPRVIINVVQGDVIVIEGMRSGGAAVGHGSIFKIKFG